jgi:hypothetical protein
LCHYVISYEIDFVTSEKLQRPELQAPKIPFDLSPFVGGSVALEDARPFFKQSTKRWSPYRLASAGSALQLIVKLLSESPGVKIVSGFGRLDHEPLGPRNFDPDRPFRVLMVGPLIEDDPAIGPEVQVVHVMGMGLGQPATLQMS